MTREELLSLHDSVCEHSRGVLAEKNHDYTGGKDEFDAFANFKSAGFIGLLPEQGILLRVLDKIQRLRTFIDKGELAVKSESVENSCEDIINYMVILLALSKERK